jgi:hypothetical protein
MNKSPEERILTLTISGPGTEDGQVPLGYLAQKFDALQKSLYNIAIPQESGQVSLRGGWPKEIRLACELFFKGFKKGSLQIETELPQPAATQLGLFVDNDLDPGLKALKNLRYACESISKNNQDEIFKLLPNQSIRQRFLKSLSPIFPREEDDMKIFMGNGKGVNFAEFTPETKKFVEGCFFKPGDYKVERFQVLRGILVEIRVLDRNRHIVIRDQGNKEIDCLYDEDMETCISQLIAGELVELHGIAILDALGNIKHFSEIIDIVMVDLSPFRIKRFIYKNKEYILNEPAICRVDYQEGYWIYEVEKYNLDACSRDRKEALAILHEQFDLLCDTILKKENKKLTGKAIELKELLKKDLKEIRDIS